MALAILQNEVQNAVLREAEEEYETYFSSAAEDVTNETNKFRKEYNRQFMDWSRSITLIKSQMNQFISMAPSLNRSDLIQHLKQINNLFSELETLIPKIQRHQRIGEQDLAKVCEDVWEDLQNYLPQPDPDQIYHQFINQPAIRANLPGIGPTEISPKELEARLKRTGTDLLTYINNLVENLDPTPFQLRSQALHDQCQASVMEIQRLEETIRKIEENLVTDLSPLAVQMINLLSQANLMTNPEIAQFVDYLRRVLDLQVDVEVGAPETSQDVILARLLQLCDRPGGYAELVSMGVELGYDFEYLQTQSEKDLCQLLSQYFAL